MGLEGWLEPTGNALYCAAMAVAMLKNIECLHDW